MHQPRLAPHSDTQEQNLSLPFQDLRHFKGQSQRVVLQLPFASANHVQIFQERTRKPCYTSLVLITFPSALVEVELPGPELHPWQQRVTGLSYVFCCLSWDGEQIE